jgi:serine/threonine-protein kinase RsbW
MGTARTSSGGEDAVTLVVPAQPEYLRLVRLAAADCGARAGLTIDEVEDLRIAVDELAYALFSDDGASGELTLRLAASKGCVEVIGRCPGPGATVSVADLSRTIIGAVADEHELSADNGARQFRLVKRGRP